LTWAEQTHPCATAWGSVAISTSTGATVVAASTTAGISARDNPFAATATADMVFTALRVGS